MEISILLARQILQFFIMILMGYLIVRIGILKSEDSKPLSLISVYILMPCVILNAFSTELTRDVMLDFLLSMLAAGVVHVVFLLVLFVLNRIFSLDPVEKFSIVYTNSGNLILPLVAGVLGERWQMFCVAFIIFQNIFVWTHGKSVLCGERKIDIAGVLKNINIIAIIVALFLFALRIRLPGIVGESLHAISLTVGPVAMFVTGMLMAGIDFKKIRAYKRTGLIVVLRMVVVSLVILCVLKFTPMKDMTMDGERILLITLFSSIAPSASVTPMLAQVYGQDAYYASIINSITLLVSIITMPLLVFLYLM